MKNWRTLFALVSLTVAILELFRRVQDNSSHPMIWSRTPKLRDIDTQRHPEKQNIRQEEYNN
jgi:hypothetical protein